MLVAAVSTLLTVAPSLCDVRSTSSRHLSEARVRSSRSKRAIRSASSAITTGRTFSATSRPSDRARQTCGRGRCSRQSSRKYLCARACGLRDEGRSGLPGIEKQARLVPRALTVLAHGFDETRILHGRPCQVFGLFHDAAPVLRALRARALASERRHHLRDDRPPPKVGVASHADRSAQQIFLSLLPKAPGPALFVRRRGKNCQPHYPVSRGLLRRRRRCMRVHFAFFFHAWLSTS